MDKAKLKNIILYVKFAILLLLVPVLYLIPTEFIFNGHPICIFRNLFGTECWGCGMTRAVFSIMYLNFEDAWEYNKLVFVVLPILIYLYLKEIIIIYKRIFNH